MPNRSSGEVEGVATGAPSRDEGRYQELYGRAHTTISGDQGGTDRRNPYRNRQDTKHLVAISTHLDMVENRTIADTYE
jgi:hypothetical protein